MAIQSHSAALQVEFAWDPDEQRFRPPNGHVITAGGIHLIPITVPFSILALKLAGATFRQEGTALDWIEPGPNSQGQPPGGFVVLRVADDLVYINLTNTHQGDQPQTFAFSIHAVVESNAVSVDAWIVNMSLSSWHLAPADRRQVGLGFFGAGNIETAGLQPGDSIHLTSPVTGISLQLFEAEWSPQQLETDAEGNFWFQLDGRTGMSLAGFNAEPATSTTLHLETTAGPFDLHLVNESLNEVPGATVTVLFATLTFDEQSQSLVWGEDANKLLITTPISILVITTVHTELAGSSPIHWHGHPPSSFYGQQVSNTQLNLYDLDAQLGLFAFSVETTDGVSDPTIVNKVPIQTEIGTGG